MCYAGRFSVISGRSVPIIIVLTVFSFLRIAEFFKFWTSGKIARISGHARGKGAVAVLSV